MNEFIGNHIKTIANWGQLISLSVFLFGLLILYFLGRKNRYFLPKGIFAWLLAFVAVIIMLLSTLVFARITQIKPGVQALLNQLDRLIDQPAPPLAFREIIPNNQHQITDFKGKVVLLNFWATWCAPCLKEMPDLNRLQADFEKEGLVVLAISDETEKRLLPYIKKHPFDAICGRVDNFTWTDLNSERPATFLIDKEGIVRAYYTGPYDYDFFAAQIKPYLTE